MKPYLAEHKHETVVCYLPSYSSDLNADEMANADLNQAVTKLAPARTNWQLVKATFNHLPSERQSEWSKCCFGREPARSAA